MLLDRVDKEPTDFTRIVTDMTWWLDQGESLVDILTSEVIPGMAGWSEAPYPPPESPPPYDPTPLLLIGAALDASKKQIVVFVDFGTPGVAYTLQFVVLGTSRREVTFELGVQVTGVPPEEPMPLPPPPSEAAGQQPGARYLNIKGGTMEGPLYLYQSPQYPTEAVTKGYVDDLAYGPDGPRPPPGAYIGDTAPGAVSAPLWWSSVTGQLYIQYDDGSSRQWVIANSAMNPPVDFLPLSGGLLTGGLSFGARVGATNDDMSQHITLHTNGYGFGVSSGRLNIIASPGGTINLVNTDSAAGAVGVDRFSVGPVSAQLNVPLIVPTNVRIGMDNAALGGVPNMYMYSNGGAVVFYADGWNEWTPSAFRGINFKVFGNGGADEYWGATGGPNGTGAALKVYSVSGGWPCIGSILASNEGQLMLGNDTGTILNIQGPTGELSRNYLRIKGAGSGDPATISVISGDTDGHMMLTAKASGNVYIGNENYAGTALATLQVGGLTADQVNGFRIAGTPTGAHPVLAAVGDDTDIGIVVAPKGAGAFRTSNDVGVRGVNSTDMQRPRVLATQIASGAGSTISGGNSNTSSANYTAVGGGYLNNADGAYSVIPGGMRAWARGQHGWLGWAAGIVQGIQEGDAQGSWRILMGTTTGSTPVRLTSDRLAATNVSPNVNSVLLGNDRAIAMTMMMVGMDRTAATGTPAIMYFVDILIGKRALGGNLILIGTPRTLGTLVPTVSLTIDGSQMLDVTVTPANANTWHFVAKFSCVEML